MRIIGGIAAGRLLKVPKGYDVRPTADLVRQALFNSLGARVLDTRVLDLYSGSGALGLECVSRGAAFVLSIEKANRHAAMIRQNLALAELPEDRHQVRVQDTFVAVNQLLAAQELFDLILADPPFGDKNTGRRSNSDSQRLLDSEALPQLLTSSGLFVLGHARRDALALPPWWQEQKTLKHGDSMIRFLQKVTTTQTSPG